MISEYGSQSKLEDRYLQDSGIRFVSPPPAELKELYEPIDERVEVGELGLEVSGNEPTESLKNMKMALHPRFVPNAPLLSHDPKYGGWIDPYDIRVKRKKNEKKFEYY